MKISTVYKRFNLSNGYCVKIKYDHDTNQLSLVDNFSTIPLGDYSPDVFEQAIETANLYYSQNENERFLIADVCEGNYRCIVYVQNKQIFLENNDGTTEPFGFDTPKVRNAAIKTANSIVFNYMN